MVIPWLTLISLQRLLAEDGVIKVDGLQELLSPEMGWTASWEKLQTGGGRGLHPVPTHHLLLNIAAASHSLSLYSKQDVAERGPSYFQLCSQSVSGARRARSWGGHCKPVSGHKSGWEEHVGFLWLGIKIVEAELARFEDTPGNEEAIVVNRYTYI